MLTIALLKGIGSTECITVITAYITDFYFLGESGFCFLVL